MKKVFISIPMKDREKDKIEKSIEKAKKIAQGVIGEEVEFINTIVQDKPPYKTNKEAIWYLGASLQLMSQADILVTIHQHWDFPGCETEYDVARKYGLGIIELDIDRIIEPEELKEMHDKKYGTGELCCNEQVKG